MPHDLSDLGQPSTDLKNIARGGPDQFSDLLCRFFQVIGSRLQLKRRAMSGVSHSHPYRLDMSYRLRAASWTTRHA